MFRVVMPWGKDKGRESTTHGEFKTAAEAFAEIDRIAAVLSAKGLQGDYLELLVTDHEGRVIPRPGVQ